MRFSTAVLAVFFLYAAAIALTTHSFNCSSSGATCNGLVGYVSPNTTTLSAISSLFFATNTSSLLPSLLGANNLPLSTLPTRTVAAGKTIKIPFPCLCRNGTGVPVTPPAYTVVAGDGLSHIAEDVFARLVTYQQIQEFNNVANASLIVIGQVLLIPLPCSCDEVGGERVVHYGYVVAPGSSVEGIAQQFNTTEETLLTLNGLASAKNLLADVAIDVPLKACTSMVGNNSLDYPLLAANGTYIFTAGNCVKCSCDSANNWTLQCESSQAQSSLGTTCPAADCQGAESLSLGNATSSGCNRTTCAYAGYTFNQTILTTLASESTCPVSGENNNAPKFSSQGQNWSFYLISIHFVLLCLHFIQ